MLGAGAVRHGERGGRKAEHHDREEARHELAGVGVAGDLDTDGEKNMLSYYQSIGRLDDLRADVLNVGHHGSKTSTSEEFLEAVAPRMAVIQVGRNNYGHPTQEVLNRLAAHGVQVFRNDRDGAVGLRIGRRGFLGLAINERGLPCLGEYNIRAVHVMIRGG